MSQYITPEEAIKLFDYAVIEEMNNGIDVYEKYMQKSALSDFHFGIAAAYYAGRIAGMRQERAKRNRRHKHETD